MMTMGRAFGLLSFGALNPRSGRCERGPNTAAVAAADDADFCTE